MDKKAKRLMTQIRDRGLPTEKFRSNATLLADYLLDQFLHLISKEDLANVVPVIVFRSSLVFLAPIVKKLPRSSIGFIGLKRDEKSAEAYQYYIHLPKFTKESIIVIFDPMLATAGTLLNAHAEVSKNYLHDTGERLHKCQIYFVGYIAAQYGYERAMSVIYKNNIVLLAVDPDLDSKKFIVPGLGDFGDRYFGT